MRKIGFTALLLFLGLIAQSCKTRRAAVTEEYKKIQLVFLDGNDAAQALLDDGNEGFFKNISAVDISIQLKRETPFKDQNEAVSAYRSFIKEEHTDFSNSDRQFLQNIFDSTSVKIGRLNQALVPNQIKLVKVKANHYGEDVYYTRNGAIMIPQNIFSNLEVEKQLPVMLHEYWHILSKSNKKLRDKAYALIGMKAHGKIVNLPPVLRNRILTNPDGVTMDYAITLGNKEVLPILTSNEAIYRKTKPVFFDYINFDLYELDTEGKIVCDKTGKSTLTAEEHAAFFAQIKDNTQYIIHVDEIMADNFMLAVLANDNNDFSKFSKEGKKLILDLIQVLKEEK